MKIKRYDKVQEFYTMLKSAINAYEKTEKNSEEFARKEETLISYFNDTIDAVRREIFFCHSGIIAMATQIKAITDRKISKNDLRQDIEKLQNKLISLTNLLKKLKDKAKGLGLAGKISALNAIDCQIDKEKEDNLLDMLERHY